MKLPELLRWQWQGYSGYHQSRTNLLLHIVAVPVFESGTVLAVIGALRLSLSSFAGGLVLMGLSLAAQGRGHRLEPMPPAPFTGSANFIARVFFEQWLTFPRFLLSGGWARNLAKASRSTPSP